MYRYISFTQEPCKHLPTHTAHIFLSPLEGACFVSLTALTMRTCSLLTSWWHLAQCHANVPGSRRAHRRMLLSPSSAFPPVEGTQALSSRKTRRKSTRFRVEWSCRYSAGATPVRPITERPSLSPPSFTRHTNNIPYGSPATMAVGRAYHVSHLLQG